MAFAYWRSTTTKAAPLITEADLAVKEVVGKKGTVRATAKCEYGEKVQEKGNPFISSEVLEEFGPVLSLLLSALSS